MGKGNVTTQGMGRTVTSRRLNDLREIKGDSYFCRSPAYMSLIINYISAPRTLTVWLRETTRTVGMYAAHTLVDTLVLISVQIDVMLSLLTIRSHRTLLTLFMLI